ncbi:hypothetical protein [Microbacterium sp. YY-01]|uniref:hypothetical protein n=1 Tax=Microbacterium sp. YY-01 TaxID=3421634 RepID=UPI003D164C7A
MSRSPQNSRNQRARAEKDRARLYSARVQWNKKVELRRQRDTIIASVCGSVVVLAAIVSQFFVAQA